MRGKVILVGEDDPEDVANIKRVLKGANFVNPVHFVSDGTETIAYLAGRGKYADRNLYLYPALLLLDLVMPQRSGLEVLSWIHNRPEPEHKALGIVVMTAMGNIEEIQCAYSLGAHSFLIKPLLLEDFVNLLNGLKGIRLETDDRGHPVDFNPREIR